jgi:hypothetical protein
VQHEPDALGFVEADFDEVVAGAQRAQVLVVVAVVQARVFLDDALEARQQPSPTGRRPVAAGGCAPCQLPWSRLPRPTVRPCGTALSMAARSPRRLSGRSAALSVLRVAIMPQPMSTPTAAGMIAPRVGMTLPIVEPLPRCTSGITARWRKMNGRRAVLSNCSRAASSTGTPSVHILIGLPFAAWSTSLAVFSWPATCLPWALGKRCRVRRRRHLGRHPPYRQRQAEF